METRGFLELGFKILAGIAAGVGVVAGISALIGNKRKEDRQDTVNDDYNERENCSESSTEPRDRRQNLPQQSEKSNNDFMKKIRSTQVFVEKSGNVIQSIVLVAETLNNLFRNNGRDSITPRYNDFRSPWDNRPSYYGNMGNGWTRHSEFIMEAPSDPRYYSSNGSGYNNNPSMW